MYILNKLPTTRILKAALSLYQTLQVLGQRFALSSAQLTELSEQSPQPWVAGRQVRAPEASWSTTTKHIMDCWRAQPHTDKHHPVFQNCDQSNNAQSICKYGLRIRHRPGITQHKTQHQCQVSSSLGTMFPYALTGAQHPEL